MTVPGDVAWKVQFKYCMGSFSNSTSVETVVKKFIILFHRIPNVSLR